MFVSYSTYNQYQNRIIKMNNNISLYIKRAEQHHTKEFIDAAFASNKIGQIRELKFIKKTDTNGREYNGVIVMFEYWNMNIIVKNLLDQMSASQDGTTRFTFDSFRGRYWIVNVYKQSQQVLETQLDLETQLVLETVSQSLSDKERILELEKLVKSMEAQMHYAQTRQEKTERQLMESEHDDTQSRLYNMELRCQVESAERIKKWTVQKIQKELVSAKEESDVLRCQNVCLGIDLLRKKKECEELRQEVYDEKCMANYLTKETQNLHLTTNVQYMLEEDMSVLTIEELM